MTAKATKLQPGDRIGLSETELEALVQRPDLSAREAAIRDAKEVMDQHRDALRDAISKMTLSA